MSKLDAVIAKLDKLAEVMLAQAALPQAQAPQAKGVKVSKPKAGKGRKVAATGVVQAQVEDESAVLKQHIADTLEAARGGKSAATCPWDGNASMRTMDAHPTRDGWKRQRFHGCKHTLNVNVAARS